MERYLEAVPGLPVVPRVAPGDIRARFSMDEAYERHERGEIGAGTYFESLRRSLGIGITDEQFAAGWNEMVRGEIAGVSEIIEATARRFPLYVFSNTNVMHHAHWGREHAALMHKFRRVFLSCELGLRKPDAAAFRRVAADIGVPLSNVLFFDDTAQNVEAARALGMQAVQVRSNQDLKRALVHL